MTTGNLAISILALERRETLDWLERAFGFELSEVTPTDDGGLAHAQLRWGAGHLMASTQGEVQQPTGAASIYLTVGSDDEVTTAYERAIAEGATSLMAPEDMPYGGRGASVRDPEGNIWSLGSYRPAQA